MLGSLAFTNSCESEVLQYGDAEGLRAYGSAVPDTEILSLQRPVSVSTR